jgi:hypothetical protein
MRCRGYPMHEIDAEEAMRRSTALADQIRPLLSGHGPEVQGAALVQLVALHLVGHPAQARESVLAMHNDAVRSLIPVVEEELFGTAGHPGNTNVN